MYSQSTLLHHGWTAPLINSVLGDPDLVTKNPHFKCAAPMKLWYRRRVLVAECSHPAVAKACDQKVGVECAELATITKITMPK